MDTSEHAQLKVTEPVPVLDRECNIVMSNVYSRSCEKWGHGNLAILADSFCLSKEW